MTTSEKAKTTALHFQYRITYGNGRFYDRPDLMIAQITVEDYKKIVLGVLRGERINEIDGISESINKMTEIVRDMDNWINMNGTNRKKPLKKARDILELEFFLPKSDYQRFKKMKNPIEVFERPEQHMTIYRNDGSSVVMSSEFGLIKIVDSRNPSSRIIQEADVFLSIIIRNV